MKIPKHFLIAWIVILVIVLIVDVNIYFDVAAMDTNHSNAIEFSPEGLPEFQFTFITLDNVVSVLFWGTAIVMGFITVGMYKINNFFKGGF